MLNPLAAIDAAEFVRYTIYGLVLASTYFIAASGLVLTYQTTGVFNLAHGAVGMASAFVYWELSESWGLPVLLSVFLTVFVAAPALGLVFEWGFRQLTDASLATTLVITVAAMAVILAAVGHVWADAQGSSLPYFFQGDSFRVGDVVITYHDVITLVVSAFVAGGIALLLHLSRIGVAMRGVVENRELAALNGVSAVRVGQLAWSVGCGLAAVAGILIAPSLGLNTTGLTLLVVSAYAAAMVGRLRSLPLTYLGALILGLAVAYTSFYAPRFFENNLWPTWLARLPETVPVIMLFVVLLILPRERLTGWNARVGKSLRIPTLRQSLFGSGVLIAITAVIAWWMPNPNQDILLWGEPLAFGLIVLSLVPIAGWGGQVPLCQITFAGLGAWVMAKWASTGSPIGLILAIAVVAAVGALVALPSLRLQGLYLTLSTLALAVVAEKMFFPQSIAFISNTSVPRVDLGFLDLKDSRVYLVFLAIAYALVASILLAIRRGPFGRRLAAMRDSPAACATLGLNLTATKLQVFALSAGIAGLGGALWGGLHQSVTNEQFTMLGGLPILLFAVIGGISTVSGALMGGIFFALLTWIGQRWGGTDIVFMGLNLGSIQWLLDLAPAVTVIALAKQPDGSVPQIAEAWERVRDQITRRRTQAFDPDDPLARVDTSMPLGDVLDPLEVHALDEALELRGAALDA